MNGVLLFGGILLALLVILGVLLWSEWRLRQQEKRLMKAQEERMQRLIQTYEERIRGMQEQHRRQVEQARKESVEQSRRTIKGQLSEQLVPLLPGFEFLPSDARFIGHPIDYIVFHGYTDLNGGRGDANRMEIFILDIKRGRAGLTPAQMAIANAVEAGRVHFQVVRVQDDGTVLSHTFRRKQQPLL